MPYDATKPYEVVQDGSGYDPSQPYEVVQQGSDEPMVKTDTLSDDFTGFGQGVIQSAKGAAQTIDTLAAVNIADRKAKLDKAQVRLQEFDQQWSGQNDPLGTLKRTRDNLVGEVAYAQGEWDRLKSELEPTVNRMAKRQGEIQALEGKLSPEMQAFNKAEGAEAFGIWAQNPVEVTANVIAQGFIGSAPALAATVVGGAAGGPAGAAAGAGLGSFTTEYANKILQVVGEESGNPSDPLALAQAILNPQLMDRAKLKGTQRGIPVAVFDAATAGLAGRFLRAAGGHTIRAIAKETGMQAAGGMAGELGGQIASGEPISLKQVAMEGVAEVGTGAIDVAAARLGAAPSGRESRPNAAKPMPSSRQLDSGDIGWTRKTGEPASPKPSGPIIDAEIVGERKALPSPPKLLASPIQRAAEAAKALGSALEAMVQGPEEDIKLGIQRPSVEDKSLSGLSDEQFSSEYRAISKELDAAESGMDDTLNMPRAQKERLAALQDRYSSYELERFRRNWAGIHPEDVMRQLLKEAESAKTHPDYATRAKMLIDELKAQKAKLKDLFENRQLSPDQAEVLRGQLADLKELVQEQEQPKGGDTNGQEEEKGLLTSQQENPNPVTIDPEETISQGIRPRLGSSETGAAISPAQVLAAMKQWLQAAMDKGRSAIEAMEEAIRKWGKPVSDLVRKALAEMGYETGREAAKRVGIQTALSDPIPFNPAVVPAAPTARHPGTLRRPGEWGNIGFYKAAGMDWMAHRVQHYEDLGWRRPAEAFSGYSRWVDKYPHLERAQAEREFAEFNRLDQSRDNGKDPVVANQDAMTYLRGMSPAGKELVAWGRRMSISTGELAEKLGVQVVGKDGLRPFRAMGATHYPRRFTPEMRELMSDPRNPAKASEVQQLVQDLVANGNFATPQEASDWLDSGGSGGKAGKVNEAFGNLERARGVKLPDKYYDYSLKDFLAYMRGLVHRLNIIEAYGQELPNNPDAFSLALSRTTDPRLQSHIQLHSDQTHGRGGASPFFRWVDGATSSVFLGWNAMYPIRNAISQQGFMAATFGVTSLVKAEAKALVHSAGAMAETMANLLEGDVATGSQRSVRIAQEMGAVGQDFSLAYELEGLDAPTAMNAIMKAGMRPSSMVERFIRTTAAMQALTWGRAASRKWRAGGMDRPSRMAEAKLNGLGLPPRETLEALKRYDSEAVAAKSEEKAWTRISPADRELLSRLSRVGVRETNFGYTSATTPQVYDRPRWRFFLKFRKFGVQVMSYIDRQLIQPLTRKVRGKWTPDVKPLVTFLLLGVLGGEATYLANNAITGRIRRDAATVSEIASKAGEGGFVGAAKDVVYRSFKDLVTVGAMGTAGENYALLEEAAVRGRWKNPIEPPGMSTVNSAVNFAMDRMQRGATLEGLPDDVAKAMSAFPPASQTAAIIKNKIAQQVAPQSDLARLARMDTERTAITAYARRWAVETGQDRLGSQRTPSQPNIGPNTDEYRQISEAISLGNIKEAVRVARELIQQAEPAKRKELRDSIIKSSSRRNPSVVTGLVNGKDDVRAFAQWMRKRVGDKEADAMVKAFYEYEANRRAFAAAIH